VRGDVLDGPGEQVVKALPLGRGERREDLVVNLAQGAVEVGEPLLALRAQRDDGPPPVGAIPAPADQARVLQAVEQTLIIDREPTSRVTVILVPETLGF
jgi:hypothetical protein